MNTVCFPRFKSEVDSQTTIEGKLPVPDGHTGASPVFFTGNVLIDKAKAESGCVSAQGEIVISVICLDDEGALYSFTSKAPFSHEAEAEDVRPDMNIRAVATLMGLNLESGGDVLNAHANVSFLFTAEENLPLYTADTESLNVSVETHSTSLEYMDKEDVFSVKSHIREEIAFPEIASVVYSNASCAVRELKSNGNDLSAECLLNIDALCRKRNGEYVQLNQSVPVSLLEEMTDMPDTDGILSGKIRVSDMEIRSLGEEFGILSLEAVLVLDVYSTKRVFSSFVDDAYTPDNSKTLVPEQAVEKALLYKCERDFRSMFSEEMEFKNQPTKILFTGVRPIITSAVKNADGTELQGIAEITLIYQNEANEIESVREERAFTISTNLTGESVEAEIISATASSNLTGSGANVTYTVCIRADEYSEVMIRPVIGISLEDRDRKKKRSGFTVCFAGEGESVFDIAKRHSVSLESVYAQNPELREKHVLCEGERVILFG